MQKKPTTALEHGNSVMKQNVHWRKQNRTITKSKIQKVLCNLEQGNLSAANEKVLDRKHE